MKKFRTTIYTVALMVSLVACQAEPPSAPPATASATEPAVVETAVIEAVEPATPEAATEVTPAEAPTVPADSPPTEASPNSDDPMDEANLRSVADLEIATPGRYVNVVFGYIVEYPEHWFTGFGNRPMLVSFSNLDPGTTNRESMRANSCLIEVGVAANVYGFTLQTLLAQMPQTYEGAETFQLSGEDAVRIVRDNENLPYVTELVQVVHDGRLFSIVSDMARSSQNLCRPAWEALLNQWTWFTPDFAPYRSVEFGYSISYPRSWIVVASSDQNILIASQESGGRSLEEVAMEGMVVKTLVMENPDLLSLKQWLAANVSDLGLTNDIELDTLRGVRSVTSSSDGVQRMTGYFQGPLGKIYSVESSYPEAKAWEFRPFANAVIYSFGF